MLVYLYEYQAKDINEISLWCIFLHPGSECYLGQRHSHPYPLKDLGQHHSHPYPEVPQIEPGTVCI